MGANETERESGAPPAKRLAGAGVDAHLRLQDAPVADRHLLPDGSRGRRAVQLEAVVPCAQVPTGSVAGDRDEVDVERVPANRAAEHAPGTGLRRGPPGRACRTDAPGDAELDVAELQARRLIAGPVRGRALAVGSRERRSDDRRHRLPGGERGQNAGRDAGCGRCRNSLGNSDERGCSAGGEAESRPTSHRFRVTELSRTRLKPPDEGELLLRLADDGRGDHADQQRRTGADGGDSQLALT